MDFQQLYEKALAELDETKAELADFKETSKLIEQELESELETSSKRTKELERENSKLKDELQELKKKQEKETKNLEQRLEALRSEKENLLMAKEVAEKKNIELENENEKMTSQIREHSMIISDLESKMNETLEQLALVQTQLELNQNQSQIHIERLKQQLKETEDELRIYQLSPTRSPDKSNSVTSSPLKLNSPMENKPYSHTVCGNPSKESPYFSLPLSKPSSFMLLNFDNAAKKVTHTELKERYKSLKKNPEFRMTCDDIKNAATPGTADKLSDKSGKNEKLKSKQHLEEKLKNFSANLNHLKSNNDGFHKSLDLVNGLIKGLDMKIQKIREMKETSPNSMLYSQALAEMAPNQEEDLVL